MEANFPACRLLLEVLDTDTLKYLDFVAPDDNMPVALWPQFASGRAFGAATLDKLLCQVRACALWLHNCSRSSNICLTGRVWFCVVQAFYNNSLIYLLSRLISDGSENEMASGSVGNADHPGSWQARERLRLRQTENARMMAMKVPTPFVNRLYKDLFSELLITKSMLAVGLYRSREVGSAPRECIERTQQHNGVVS